MNNFLYEDRTGKHLRAHTKVALVIFVVIIALWLVGMVNHRQMVSPVMATPRPSDKALIPAATAQVAAPVDLVEACPSDPASWSLTDNPSVPGSNLKMPGPRCVYESLERTAAWVYATTALGYSRSTAADALGLPWKSLITYVPAGQISVLTDYHDEPQQVEVIAAVNYASLGEWRVNADNETGLAIIFSGCFATSTFDAGGQVTTWGDGYPVVCQFYADYRTQYMVSSTDNHVFTIDSVRNTRRPIWFGYIGAGSWTWLGSGKVWDIDLAQIPLSAAPTLDASVMKEKYGMTALPLPQNWKSAAGQEFSDAFVAELNGDH
jgi:hypothetical protein